MHLMAMLIMQYAANRPAFMGNPNHETDELLRIHHAVPALQYERLWNKTAGIQTVGIHRPGIRWKTAG